MKTKTKRKVPDKGILKQFMFYAVNEPRSAYPEAFEIWTWTRDEQVARSIAVKEWNRLNKRSGKKLVAMYRTKQEAIDHKPATVTFDTDRMWHLVGRQPLLTSMLNKLTDDLTPEKPMAYWLEVLFNSEVVWDSVMEAEYMKGGPR